MISAEITRSGGPKLYVSKETSFVDVNSNELSRQWVGIYIDKASLLRDLKKNSMEQRVGIGSDEQRKCGMHGGDTEEVERQNGF